MFIKRLIGKCQIKYLGAVAATLILLAWSVDNFLQKEISSISRAISDAKSVQLRVEFQTSVLHDIADLRNDFQDYLAQQKNEARTKEDVPIEFLNLNAGRLRHVYRLTERMQDFRLAAELYQSTFHGVKLPADIEKKMSDSVDFYWRLNSDLAAKQGEIQDFIREVMLRKFGGKPPRGPEDMPSDPDPEPTQQDIRILDEKFDEYWNISQKYVRVMDINRDKLHTSHSEALSFVASRRDAYDL